MEKDKLQQADLTDLRLQDMTPDQRAELRRRYDHFLRHFGRGGVTSRHPAPKSQPRKWVPGKKR